MKVYTELVVWVDFNEIDNKYVFGYLGYKNVIQSVSRDNADCIPKIIWDMLHTDMR